MANLKRRTTTVETAVLLFFQSLSLNLKVVVEAANFTWTTTSLIWRTSFPITFQGVSKMHS